MPPPTASDDAVVSYLTLRKVVGVLGIALPVVVYVWGVGLTGAWGPLPSISDYYSLRTRDAFVGILFTVAWFLLTYRGYDRRDDWAGNLACVFALGVALVPSISGASHLQIVLHTIFATALFLVLAYFSFCLFTRSGPVQTEKKKIRNKVYRVCGVVIVACIVLIGVYGLFLRDTGLARLRPVFVLETVALWAFGLSWFVKGEAILKD